MKTARIALAGVFAFAFNAYGAEPAPAGFVHAEGGRFVLDGSVFRFAGTNNYYLHYESDAMVDDVIDAALRWASRS